MLMLAMCKHQHTPQLWMNSKTTFFQSTWIFLRMLVYSVEAILHTEDLVACVHTTSRTKIRSPQWGPVVPPNYIITTDNTWICPISVVFLSPHNQSQDKGVVLLLSTRIHCNDHLFHPCCFILFNTLPFNSLVTASIWTADERGIVEQLTVLPNIILAFEADICYHIIVDKY